MNKSGIFGEFVYQYTRAEATQDGALINLSGKFPEECHLYRYPVACTAAVWSLIEQATSDRKHGNTAAGVVWDIMTMSQQGVFFRPDAQTALFNVIITGTGRKQIHTMKAVCHPGDNMEPVITIMLPRED